MLTVNLDKSLVFVIVRCYFLNLFPFNLVFGTPRGGQEDYCPPLCTPLYRTRGVFRNLSRGGGLNLFSFQGGSAPVWAWNPMKSYRYISLVHGGLSPYSPSLNKNRIITNIYCLTKSSGILMHAIIWLCLIINYKS